MKRDMTRRDFVSASITAGLALGPLAQTLLAQPGAPAGASASTTARKPRTTGKRKHEGVQLTILDAWKQPLETLVAEFHELTGATVKFERLDEIHGWWALEPVAMADAATGQRKFDLFLSDANHTWTLAPHLLPMDDYIRTSGYDMSDFFTPITRDGAILGARYGLPNRARVPMVLYRKDLIGDLPTNWSDYEKALKAATGRNMFGLSAVRYSYPYHPHGLGEELTKMFLARFWSLGAREISAERRPLIAGEKGREALEMLKRQVDSFTSPEAEKWDGDAAIEQFVQGRAATVECVPSPRLLRRLEQASESKVAGKWAFGNYPGGKTGGYFTFQEMRVFKHSKNPEAAFDFVAHCTNPAAARHMFTQHAETSPRKNPWLENPHVSPEQNRTIVSGFERGIMFAAGEPEWLELLTALWEATEYYMKGYLTSQRALEVAAARFEKALKRSG